MAILDAVVTVVTSLLVGGVGTFAGVRLIADGAVSVESALLTALVGALTWGVVVALVGLVPFVGPLLALAVWIAVVALRHAEDWPTAAVVGFAAWTLAVAALYALSAVGVVSLAALGVPDLSGAMALAAAVGGGGIP